MLNFRFIYQKSLFAEGTKLSTFRGPAMYCSIAGFHFDAAFTAIRGQQRI